MQIYYMHVIRLPGYNALYTDTLSILLMSHYPIIPTQYSTHLYMRPQKATYFYSYTRLYDLLP